MNLLEALNIEEIKLNSIVISIHQTHELIENYVKSFNQKQEQVIKEKPVVVKKKFKKVKAGPKIKDLKPLKIKSDKPKKVKVKKPAKVLGNSLAGKPPITKEKSCPECGDKFIPKSNRQIMCSKCRVRINSTNKDSLHIIPGKHNMQKKSNEQSLDFLVKNPMCNI